VTTHHLAQLNIARPVAPVDDPVMADFVGNLDRLNAVADAAPGFIWRLQDADGNATALRPFGPEIMVNMSVWASVEQLRDYTYRSAHLDMLRRRRQFFVHDADEVYAVLWWVPAGHIPTVEEAWERLELLRTKGSGPQAFTFRDAYPPPD
jgi:hypothetical protein